MALVNTSKPTTVLTNTTKTSGAELWSTITSTWTSETRTWNACISLFTNPAKPTTTFSNVAKPA